MIKEYKGWQINNIEDFDEFARQADKEGLTWGSGERLTKDKTFREYLITHGGFPKTFEISQNCVYISPFVSIPKIFSQKEVSENKTQKPGIYLLKENKEVEYYSYDNFLKNPKIFIEKIQKENGFKIGDEVRIIDNGWSYTSYSSWFKENNVDIDIAARYAFCSTDYSSYEKFIIVAKGKHINDENRVIYAITPAQNSNLKPVFLFGEKGLEKINN